MVPHPKEDPELEYTLETELKRLKAHKAERKIPDKSRDKLLTATWNLTNFGVQERTTDDLTLMAEVISWFDLVAIQEIADSLENLRTLMSYLPPSYKVILSDIGGNDERAGFLYDSTKVERLELAAEVAVPPNDHRYIRMKGVSGAFNGFDRNPYVVAFQASKEKSKKVVKKLSFSAVSVHLYFGSNTYYDEDRRALEAFALARWADQRQKASANSGDYSGNLLILGDMNLPKLDPSDNVFRVLTSMGLVLPKHSSSMGSNLASDKQYDQVAFHAGGMQNAFDKEKKLGVFDFDNAIFKELWEKDQTNFFTAVKYHIADHRPLWVEFDIPDVPPEL